LPQTWEVIRGVKQGTAVCGMPSRPIKCAGAPQEIAHVAADYWWQQSVLGNIRVVLVLPTPSMFGVPFCASRLICPGRQALSDAGSTPNSKTGAAIRKQAPVVVESLRHSDGRQGHDRLLRPVRLAQQDAARRVGLHDAADALDPAP